MIARLRQRLTRPVINHDDSGSMILALFVIIVLTSLVSVVLAASISQQAKTRQATDFTFAGQAANTAVSDALLMANQNGPSGGLGDVGHWDGTPSRVGVSGDFMWSWSAEQDLRSSTPTWQIVAVGCRNKNAETPASTPVCTTSTSKRTITATLSGRVVDGAEAAGGEAAYVLTPKRNFNRALFADQDLIMQGTSRVASYSSLTGPAEMNTGFGQVASNGLASFGTQVIVDGVYISNTQTFPSRNRCEGSPCSPDLRPRKLFDIPPKLKVDAKFIDDKIATCGPLKAWVSSKAVPRAILPEGIHCYSSMTFDEDTTVSVVAPAEIYVNGPIALVGRVKVNMVPTAKPVASRLAIFSSHGVVSLGGGPTTQADLAWVLWAPKALCAPSKPAGMVTVYGAMMCRKIFTQGQFIAYWDEALRTYGSPGDPGGSAAVPGLATIWDINEYREGL